MHFHRTKYWNWTFYEDKITCNAFYNLKRIVKQNFIGNGIGTKNKIGFLHFFFQVNGVHLKKGKKEKIHITRQSNLATWGELPSNSWATQLEYSLEEQASILEWINYHNKTRPLHLPLWLNGTESTSTLHSCPYPQLFFIFNVEI